MACWLQGGMSFFALDHGLQWHPLAWDRLVTTCSSAYSPRFGPKTGHSGTKQPSTYPQILLRMLLSQLLNLRHHRARILGIAGENLDPDRATLGIAQQPQHH